MTKQEKEVLRFLRNCRHQKATGLEQVAFSLAMLTNIGANACGVSVSQLLTLVIGEITAHEEITSRDSGLKVFEVFAEAVKEIRKGGDKK